MPEDEARAWLLLIHSIPPKPDYLRVKVGRRLQRVGAVALKNSVYVLPSGEQGQEDFQWLLREVVAGGGDAYICESRFVEGLTDRQVEDLFRAARDADYGQLAEEARGLLRALEETGVDGGDKRAEGEYERLARRFGEIAAIDFFHAEDRGVVEGLLAQVRGRLLRPAGAPAPSGTTDDLRGKLWVTREGIKIDRMASAWLVCRFIDPNAAFKFVPAMGYVPGDNEIRFDMYEAEVTHEGDRCTFEVLLQRLSRQDHALAALAEIVHDIDLKDAKFKRTEADGLALVVSGIAAAHPDDEARLARSAAVFDDLYVVLKGSQP